MTEGQLIVIGDKPCSIKDAVIKQKIGLVNHEH